MTDKYCINCVHFFCPDEEVADLDSGKLIRVSRHPNYAVCRRVENPRSLVTGQHEGDLYPYCSVARESPCGSSARFFEEKTK